MTARTLRVAQRSGVDQCRVRLVRGHALDLFDVFVDGVALGRLVLDRPAAGGRVARDVWLAVLRGLGLLVRACHGSLELFQ